MNNRDMQKGMQDS